MARSTEADRIKTIRRRIRSADKLYSKWSSRFETDRLEKYYLGEQWRGHTDEESRSRYTINMVFASIETNKPSLSFHRPKIKMQPRPGRAEQFGSTAEQDARLSQDAVQTFIDDPDVEFSLETSLALHEAHFRFGVIEVGYSADWIDNPNSGKPLLKDNSEDQVMGSNGPVMQPAQIASREDIYIKHIPAHTFRVSISSKNSLIRNDWVGYYEWHYTEDVKADKRLKNTAGLKATGVINKEIREDDEDSYSDSEYHHGMTKLWKIWDLRASKRLILADGYDKFLLDKEFKFCPFAVLKFHEILNEFYPAPPVYQWLGPQDEVNETRDSQKAHRSRFYRRYTYTKGSIEASELEKLETGGPGVYAESNVPDPLHPVQDASMGADVWQHLDESKNDFLQVSGVTGEQRGVAEADTATQANIIDTRSRIREASIRTRVAEWLSQIARLMLISMREHMTLPFWVQQQVDPFVAAMNPEAVMGVVEQWKRINAEDLSTIDLDINVDLASLSPVTEDVQRNSWNAVLGLLTNPTLLNIFSQSEALLRRTLFLYGIRSENEVREIMRVAQAIIAQMQQAAMAEANAKGISAAPPPGGSQGGGPTPGGPQGLPPPPSVL